MATTLDADLLSKFGAGLVWFVSGLSGWGRGGRKGEGGTCSNPSLISLQTVQEYYYTAHCPKNNLHLRIKTEAVTIYEINLKSVFKKNMNNYRASDSAETARF